MTPSQVTRYEGSGNLRDGAGSAERLLPERDFSESQTVDRVDDGGFFCWSEVGRESKRQINKGCFAEESLEVLEVFDPGKVTADGSILNSDGDRIVERSCPSHPGDRFRDGNSGT